MLNVSDIVEVARGGRSAGAVTSATPERYAHAGDAPAVVVWNICHHCNQSCPHCYAAASKKPSPGDLSTTEAREVVDQLASAGVRFVIFSGGEPLLRQDLTALVERARERGMTPQLSTNGVLLDATTASRVAAAGVSYVGISIDGREAFNDSYRGMQGGFRLASAGITNALGAGMRVGLRVTVTRRNAGEVEPLLGWAGELGAHRFYVSHLIDAGRGRRLSGVDLDPPEARTMLHGLFARAEQLLDGGQGPRIVTGGNDSDGPLLVSWLRDRYGETAASRAYTMLRRRGGNSAGEAILAIDHRGRVHPDQFWQSLTLGDLRSESFREILAHPMRAELRDRVSKLTGRCGRCPFVDICRGSHRERALARSGSMWASDPTCVLPDRAMDVPVVEMGGAA